MQKKITYGGIGAALCVLVLVISAYLPTGRAASLFIASVLCYTMCYLSDCRTAVTMYVASTLLSFIFMPSSSTIVSFAICFGNYPIIKSYIDTKPQKFCFVLKFVLYTIYFLAVYFVFKHILNITIPYVPFILYAFGVLVFYFYDWLLVSTGRYIMYLLHK